MNGRPWSSSEIETLRRDYPDVDTADLCLRLNRSVSSIYGQAHLLGLRKSNSYLRVHCRIQHGQRIGRAGEFPKGHIPANKGLRRPGWSPGRMRETQFKKGQRPHTWKPIGSERLCDGYLQRKVTDTGYPPRDWQPVHVLLWIEHYGPIPRGYAVKFIDGDRRNVVIENLCLVSRADLARLNVMWNRYPRELAEAIQLRGVLRRRLNKRRTVHEEQDQRPA